jgi:hypothetical protein
MEFILVDIGELEVLHLLIFPLVTAVAAPEAAHE